MRSSNRSRWAPYLFLLPFFAVFAVFVAYPLGHSMQLAFHQTYGPTSSEYVGLSNFRTLLRDADFWKAVRNTVIFTVGAIVTQVPAALGLAMLLNRPGVRGRAFWRLIFFAPSLVGLAFVAILASLVFLKNTGLLNVALHNLVGFDREFPWLERHVMAALIIAAFWMYVGFNMVYFLAALQNVERGLIEAATIDGANAWGRFRHVTLPSIWPVGTFIVLLSLIGSFQLFDLPYLLLKENGKPMGGPDNQGLTIVMYLYQHGFERGDLGYASAIGWLLALLLIGFAVVQLLVSRTGVRS